MTEPKRTNVMAYNFGIIYGRGPVPRPKLSKDDCIAFALEALHDIRDHYCVPSQCENVIDGRDNEWDACREAHPEDSTLWCAFCIADQALQDCQEYDK